MGTNDPLFDRFWSAYPRRVAKQAARNAWAKLRVDEELLLLMLRALQWQQREWTDIRYVPHPATWLNGRRWEDENPNERGGEPQSIQQIIAEIGRRQ